MVRSWWISIRGFCTGLQFFFFAYLMLMLLLRSRGLMTAMESSHLVLQKSNSQNLKKSKGKKGKDWVVEESFLLHWKDSTDCWKQMTHGSSFPNFYFSGGKNCIVFIVFITAIRVPGSIQCLLILALRKSCGASKKKSSSKSLKNSTVIMKVFTICVLWYSKGTRYVDKTLLLK